MKIKFPKNKWFYAFAAAAVVAIAAIVVAIVVGVTSGRSNAQAYNEGEEVGVYYYDVKDGEMVLTLSGGNKFTLTGPNTNKTGTYTVDGAVITLDFIKDEDGTTTATIEGDKLTLTYDNATMPFLKKVSYTVSFNTNGGSEIAAVAVVNGKTVSKPADPAKENAVFLGWYADEALTTAFNFDAVVVKANTTVYAKWAEKTVGVADYTVNFDLGYQGAEALAPIETVSGKAYNVPTPEREGFTFGGWWVSMSDNAEKLSYAYTENTVFTADTTLYAVWYDNAATALKAPAVSVSANAITWDAVTGAVSYKLTVVAPDGTVLVDNKTVGATAETFDFAGKAAGEYKVYVVAVASNEANNSAAAERYFSNKTLDKVTGFQVVNGWLVYGTVANAEKYIVTVDCGNDGHVHTEFDNGTSTVFNIANCQMQKGGILVTVTAVAEGYAPSTSKVFAYDLTLDKVANVIYKAESDTVIWDKVENATAYVVTVKVGEKTYTVNNGAATEFSAAEFSGDFTVAVVPVTEGYNSPEATSVACKKTAPAAPTGVAVSGMVISWNAVEGAVAYEVKIGDQIASVTTNAINLADATNIILNQGQTYAVSVKAVNAANEGSAYSKAVSFGYFILNPVLTYNKNTVYWTPVLGVNNYQVRVNGGELKSVENANSATVTLTKEGDNLVEVRYVYGTTFSEWVSMNVKAYAVEYDSRTGTNGVIGIEYLAVGDVLSLPSTGFEYDGYYFSGWYNTPKGAEGNGKMYAEGATFNGNAYTVVYAEWSPKTYDVTLDTLGFNVTNIANGTVEHATYTKNFTLSVPVTNRPDSDIFMGWFTGPQGAGKRLTDEYGVSLAPYNFTRNITLYPYFSNDALEFVLQEDDTYAVKKGINIDNVSNLIIPVTYNDKPVTVILESAFSQCKKLQTISIPDTIKLVGTKALDTCSILERIDVYEANPGEVYEKIYSSDNGVLIREDMGTTYLEVVPRAMTGEYTVPANVDKILTKAFYYTAITKITIPANVQSLPQYAFYSCKSLTEVNIAGGRATPIVIEDGAFYNCNAVTAISVPNNIDADFAAIKGMLDDLKSLKSITVEEGGTEYASVGGMLTNANKDTILYCPYGYTGAFTVPQGIKTIGEQAFYMRAGITSVTVPIWVTNIGERAFYMCENVKTLVFKGSRVENLTIADEAFEWPYALESITFEGNGNFGDEGSKALDTGAVTIGEMAFYSSTTAGKANLSTVTIEAGANIASIGKHAFAYCVALNTFSIDDNAYVGTIGESAFYRCYKLTQFTVPATVSSIDANAFKECSNLASVTFKEGTTALSIANYAFQDCVKLASITIPNRLYSFNYVAFEGCDNLKKILVGESDKYKNDENGVLYEYETVDEVDVLKNLLFYPKGLAKEKNGVINDLPATLVSIGGAAFANNKYLIEVTLPKTVTTIGLSAFEGCENLTKVNFATPSEGETLTLAIGDAAFRGCLSLANEFALPAYTTSIGNNAFNSTGLVNFVIPEGVTSIGYGAFAWCESLTSVEFKCKSAVTLEAGTNNSKTGKPGVFANCILLESITLPATLTAVPAYAFYECTSLSDVNFTPVTETTGEGAGQTTVTYYNLNKIGNYAFRYCNALEEIFIPKSVTSIGNSAFEGKSATDPGSLSTITFELGGTAGLEIGTTVFKNQPQLTSITFPARLSKMLGKGPITTSNIGTSAALAFATFFEGCNDLAAINVAVEEGITGNFTSLDGVLYNKDKTILLYCPVANVGTYVGGTPTYEITVPTSVKMVASKAFFLNTRLKTVTFAEFDKTDANYGKQLLTIGNYSKSGTSTFSDAYKYAAFGGTTSSIEVINLPSHLQAIKSGAFAVQDYEGDHAIALNINPDASNVQLYRDAFTFCKATSITIHSSFLAIYNFYACKYLTTVNLSVASNITAFPNYMFYKCPALESFSIPTNITQLGTFVFSNCTSLANVSLHEGITNLGNNALQATAITSITVPASVTTFGTNMFDGCSSLQSVKFAEGSKLTTIPNYTFQYCTGLTEQTVDISAIAANITSIGNSAFKGCEGITTFDFSRLPKLKTIGTNAFSYSGLVDVDLSGTVITKLDTSFNNNPQMKTLVLPATVTSIASAAFTNSTGVEKVTILNPNLSATMISAFAGLGCEVVFPAEMTNFVIDQYGVVYDRAYQILYSAAFVKDLTGYTIPETVTTIYANAFMGVKIDKLEIPESVTVIGASAFQGAEIRHVVMSSNVAVIEKDTFASSTLEKIEFRNEHQSKLTTINNFAFQETNLVEFVMPDSVTTISYSLFLDCTKLEKVVFSASLKVLGNGTMGNVLGKCYALEEIVFQEGLEQVNQLFLSYTSYKATNPTNNVTSINIPSTVKTLQDSAFCYFANLETITFAKGSQLEFIGDKAFQHCHSLKNIDLPASLATIETNAFEHCYALESIDLEKTAVEDLPKYAFAENPNLAEVKLPAGLSSIGDFAFYGSGVESIYIPAGVTAIGVSAFENCTALKTVTFSPDNMMTTLGDTESDTNIFRGTTALETVTLPNFLKVIGDRVFENSGIKAVKMFDESVDSELQIIGDYAFADCERLESFDHFANVNTIQSYAFFRCANLVVADADAHKADLEGVTEIGAMAFAFCEKLPVAYIPASVVVLGGNPYAGLDKSKIVVDDANAIIDVNTDANGVVTIHDVDGTTVYGVYGATGEFVIDPVFASYAVGAVAGNAITSVTIPAKLGNVVDCLFMNCAPLANVVIEEGITTIGSYAFYGTSISTVTIPESVTTIGAYAFADCDALNNVVIPNNVTVLGAYCFAYCDTLSEFEFEESTAAQEIGDHFFFNCPNITEVILPSKIKISKAEVKLYGQSETYCTGTMPSYMFAGTGIVEAHIPTQIAHYFTDGVFANCKNLEKIVFEYDWDSDSTGRNKTMFEGCDKFQGIWVEDVTNGYLYVVEYAGGWGIYDVHIETISSENTVPLKNFCRIQYASSDVSIYFDGNTYQEIIEYFKTVERVWSCKVFDKDGNQLFCAEDSGNIGCVKDKNGNVIWEPTPVVPEP